MGKTIAELHAMLKLYEKGISKKDETPAVLAIREGKIHKDKKKPQGAKGKDKRKNKLAYDPKPRIPPLPKRDNLEKDFVCYHCKEVGSLRKPEVETWCFESVSGQWNANKRDKHALDSSYQWHCRLGHINKKHMDKLQRDGILQLTHNESLKKCKSCIFGKIWRKPFPHQVERAKDLLGLIHNDVCGPFRTVSREVSERRNRTLLDMVRSMMNLTTLPKSFWGYALESALRILNMVPTKKVERTPYEICHMKAPKLSYLRVWGCEALIKQDTPDKLNPGSIMCIFVGYLKEMIGYYFYYPLKNKIFIARNVEFFENSLMVQEASGSHGFLELSGSDKGLELIQEDDTQPYENTSERLIALSQSAYLEKTLKKFKMENSKKGYTPMIENHDYRKSQGAQTPSEVQHIRKVPYASAIGSIMYATAVKTILKYLRNTKDMVLVYGAKLEADLKSTKQSTIVMSSTEAEYIAVVEASIEAVWMRKFIDGLGDVMPSNKRPMEMLCDNKHAIAIANVPKIIKGARHFQRKYNYIREVIQARENVLKKVYTNDNVADPFTKPMPFNKHHEHAMVIRIVPASSLM
nr:retrotransposon protein, putative, Ty1-copia subclass [Tanacetum cinerariifolium]